MDIIDQVVNDDYAIYHSDCVEGMKGIPDDSIHYSIYSPPFASLFTYSNSDRDMGNSATRDEFWQHYKFLIDEHYRTHMPGRIISVHCMNLPTSKQNDGFIGISDFRGEIIRAFQDAGFIYHSEVVIWKDPVVAMQRTKALGLLHKTIQKDSSRSRQGLPDYLVMFRKPGENPEPIEGLLKLDEYAGNNMPDVAKDAFNGETERWNSINIWQQYASPVWMDINQSNTLQYRNARDEDDERHICPLQLDVISRGLQLWSNPCDTVLSPFGGIGSEGYMAVKMRRKPVLFELKDSYFAMQKQNMEQAIIDRDTPDLFDMEETA